MRARCRRAVFAAQHSTFPRRSKARTRAMPTFASRNASSRRSVIYPDDKWGMVNLNPEQQSMLVEAEPEIFRPVPGGWGKGGSTNVRLAMADAATLQSA